LPTLLQCRHVWRFYELAHRRSIPRSAANPGRERISANSWGAHSALDCLGRPRAVGPGRSRIGRPWPVAMPRCRKVCPAATIVAVRRLLLPSAVR
jgi:hypothetical protein